ncbi:MAG: chemotaxis protein CheA [Epulopiscium sp. Nele67-Bin005]|nr:MAG: chemotaxis protein CheA [Epulopiscium sp. Nele67-Bin005]
MDMNQYLQIFIEESRENLQSLNENLLKLEGEPDNIQVLNDIFRVAHTLKGMAGTMGFVRMQSLTHSIENVLSEIRNGELHITPEMLDILFQCLDALENYVDQIINTSSEGDESYSDLIDQLEAILATKGASAVAAAPAAGGAAPAVGGGAETKSSTPPDADLPAEVAEVKDEALRSGLHAFKITITLSSNCMLKAARSFVIFNDLESMGEVIHTVPSVQDIEDEKFDQQFTLYYLTQEEYDKIYKTVETAAEVEGVAIDVLEQTPVQIAEEKVEPTPAPAAPAASTPAPAAPAASTPAPAAGGAKQQVAGKSVRVNIERLDTLMNLVSELIIIKTQLEGLNEADMSNSESNYSDSVEYLERITTSLHDAVMKVRMVPVETVFNRFPRMIRDVSRKIGKNIELVMSGEETELDRTVVDEIGDPLIHILRNAADHGLETTAERIAIGKNEKGTINLRAYQDGNSVVIEVQDDGKGIDTQKIKQKAFDRGDISREVFDSMSEQEAIDLLFRPSFSTAEQITDLSGRGVGLDVVKSKITALGGLVEVETKLGKGSRFIVRLPLTLAIIQALMVNVGGEKYAIPLNTIQNIENITGDEIKLVQNQEVIVLRTEVIPIVRLDSILGLESSQEDNLIVVIVKKGEKQVGFVVDSLTGQQEIVIKPLGKYLGNIHMIAGATILGNGEVALILDINTLV